MLEKSFIWEDDVCLKIPEKRRNCPLFIKIFYLNISRWKANRWKDAFKKGSKEVSKFQALNFAVFFKIYQIEWMEDEGKIDFDGNGCNESK